MKKLIYLLSLNVIFALTFAVNVNASNLSADQLTPGQLIEAGDVLALDTSQVNGHSLNGSNGEILICLDGINPAYYSNSPLVVHRGESYTFTDDCYFIGYNGHGHAHISSGSYSFVDLLFHTVKPRFYTMDNDCAFSSLSDYKIEIQEGTSKRIYLDYEGGTSPYTIEIVGYMPSIEDGASTLEDIVLDSNHFDVEYNQYEVVVAKIYCPTGKGENNYSGFCRLFITNVASTKEDTNSEEPQHPTSEPQVPSTVPNGIAQVSIGSDNKTFANIKALNQFPHDAINQKLIADIYATKLRKKADVLIQKNLFPPYGVKNEWKTISHVVKWKDLNVKKGDSVLVVWYTPTFWGRTSTLKYITATVVEDGIIEFTIPYMGDMSVMSIVKLM